MAMSFGACESCPQSKLFPQEGAGQRTHTLSVSRARVCELSLPRLIAGAKYHGTAKYLSAYSYLYMHTGATAATVPYCTAKEVCTLQLCPPPPVLLCYRGVYPTAVPCPPCTAFATGCVEKLDASVTHMVVGSTKAVSLSRIRYSLAMKQYEHSRSDRFCRRLPPSILFCLIRRT